MNYLRYQYGGSPRWWAIRRDYIEGKRPWVLPLEKQPANAGQIRRFLGAILRGMPTGTLTLTRLKLLDRGVQDFLLDGFQRISTLYSATVTGDLSVTVDLRDDKELRVRVDQSFIEGDAPLHFLPLHLTKDPLDLWLFTKKLEKAGHEDWANRARFIQERIHNHKFPIQLVFGDDRSAFESWVQGTMGCWNRYKQIQQSVVFPSDRGEAEEKWAIWRKLLI